MVVSDALSRAYLLSQTTKIQEYDLIHQISSVQFCSYNYKSTAYKDIPNTNTNLETS